MSEILNTCVMTTLNNLFADLTADYKTSVNVRQGDLCYVYAGNYLNQLSNSYVTVKELSPCIVLESLSNECYIVKVENSIVIVPKLELQGFDSLT